LFGNVAQWFAGLLAFAAVFVALFKRVVCPLGQPANTAGSYTA
jgi:hypothetical protein